MNSLTRRLEKVKAALDAIPCPDCSLLNNFAIRSLEHDAPMSPPLYCTTCGKAKDHHRHRTAQGR